MGMDMGGAPGTLLPFLGLWATMMTAMMFPSVAPTAILWIRAIQRHTSGIRSVARLGAFIAGYLLAWTAYGLFAFFLLEGASRMGAVHGQAWRWFQAGALAVAGVYQLSPLKDYCLRHCRSPMTLLMTYAGYRGWSKDLRVGLHHGLYCLGCCWGLMLALVAVGVMNPAAMAIVAAVIFVEKLWRFGPYLARVAGAGLVVAASVVLVRPM